MFSIGAATLTLLGIFCLPFATAQVDWCAVQSQHCWGQHIACPVNNNFPTTTSCFNVELVPMTSSLKGFILNRHNEYRQQIASGSNSEFPEAQKMTVMQWDDTLQFLAETHVSHCTFQHDDCRATPDFPYSGQNLYYTATSGTNTNATAAAEKGLKSWFEEWKVADPDIVDSIEWEMWAAFHFSIMVHDQNNYVGCGLLKYSYMSGSTQMNSFMLTCNYEYTNMLSEPMYVRGTPCSQCTCSTTYPSLCVAAGSGSGGGSGSGSGGSGSGSGEEGGSGTCGL